MTKTYKLNNTTVSADEIKRLIKENPELLEEKVYKPWRAEKHNEYCFVNQNGNVVLDEDWGLNDDDFRYLTSNYFRTEEEAEAHKARLEAIGRVTHAILAANKGWEPDWSDEDEGKYYLYYSHSWNKFEWGQLDCLQDVQILPFAKSSEIVETIISEYEDDLRIIFELD